MEMGEAVGDRDARTCIYHYGDHCGELETVAN
jgi:hypothetical protein